MRIFYCFVLAWTRLELKIALAVRASPEYVEQLQKDESKWEHELLLLDINNL